MEVLTISGEVKRQVELPSEWFNRSGPKSLLWDAVRCYLANQRQGTAKTKTRGEVSGTGKKPWPQKHTGRARHGSRRSPIWRGGGIAWGPKPRDYSYELPKKVRRQALALALTSRAKENGIKIVEDFELNEPKTRELVNIVEKIASPLAKGDKVLLLVERASENLVRASQNVSWLDVMPAAQLNSYQVLTHQKLIFTEKGLESFLTAMGVK
ncbi:50S ribosomal protein L4 [candidate division WOR-3 bacterium]|nr:50S ribosomal protein L4 [candidate division WOR-3 bacterium]